MVANYIDPPPPRDVSDAIKLIHDTVNRLSYEDIRILANRLRKAERDVLLTGFQKSTSEQHLKTGD